MLLGTIQTQTITFFRSEARAKELAEVNGGEAEGFRVIRRTDDRFVIEVFDPEDSFHLGYL